MLADVTADLKVPNVREYLLNNGLLEDIRVLSQPGLPRSAPYSMNASFHIDHMTLAVDRLPVPAARVGAVDVGVMAQHVGGSACLEEMYGRSMVFMRYCADARKQSFFALSVDQNGSLEMNWTSILDPQRLLFVALWLDRPAFESLGTVEQAILRTDITLLTRRPQANLEHAKNNFTFSSVVTRYNSGVPIFSVSRFGSAAWTRTLPKCAIDQMRAWAITNRLQLLAPAPPNSLRVDFDFSGVTENEDDVEN